MSERQLQGKVAIVSGAGSRIGLGHAMTLALVGAGARVAMMDVDAQALEQSAADARGVGGKDCVLPIVGDVTNPADAEMTVRRTIAELGAVHILVNNAGISPRNPSGPRFWELPVENWTRTIATNFSGQFFMARAVAPRLLEQGWGRIIGVTTSFDTMLRSTPYGPAKAGHEALVAVMARELEGTGVTAKVLVPGGATYTNMTAGAGPRPGMLQPEVMQAPVVWLASNASDGFSGHRIIGKFWDESLEIERRLAKAASPGAWPELADKATSQRG